MAIDPDTVSGEQERDSGVSVHTDGRERISLMEPYKGRIAPVGEGLTGRGVEHPPPLSLACHRDNVLTSGNTPAARPLTRPPPAPSRGGGQ